MQTQSQAPIGIDYIVNSKKPYPDWIKGHQVFKELNRIDKVFPRIGLPNFSEPVDISNSSEATDYGYRLGNAIYGHFVNINAALLLKLNTLLKSAGKDRNDNCRRAQLLYNLIFNFNAVLAGRDYLSTSEGKIVLALSRDIFGEDKNPMFRAGQPILRVAGQLIESVHALNINTGTSIDQLQAFKDFSRVNTAQKKYTLTFSSIGEDGVWDIATASMRGITSCQAWNAPQARGLIGSISSKFVGVVFISSGEDVPGYGSKMLYRAMVRFAIHKVSKKPVLIMDTIYPQTNNDITSTLKKTLSQKSGLEVIYTREKSEQIVHYYLPQEPSQALLKQGETTYMDYAIEVKSHPSVIKSISTDLLGITKVFKTKVYADINEMVNLKRGIYEEASTRLSAAKSAWDIEKTKWEEVEASKPEADRLPFTKEAPQIDPDIAAFGKGGIINLLLHCDKKYGKGKAAEAFAKLILDNIEVDQANVRFATQEQYHRAYVMSFLRNPKKAREIAFEKYKLGSWMKSFPKSSAKFFDLIFDQMKGYMLASAKEMIKKGVN